ncbi:hypothetical protein Aperf_G00000058874 [Anoplocephala perfoliata]
MDVSVYFMKLGIPIEPNEVLDMSLDPVVSIALFSKNAPPFRRDIISPVIQLVSFPVLSLLPSTDSRLCGRFTATKTNTVGLLKRLPRFWISSVFSIKTICGQYNSVFECAALIYRELGVRGIFCGFGVNVVVVIPYAGIELATYEFMKSAYIQLYMRHILLLSPRLFLDHVFINNL